MDAEFVPETHHAQLDYINKKANADHAHPIALNASRKLFARPVFQVSRSTRWLMMAAIMPIVLKFAVMAKDLNLTAMTVIPRMVTVATQTVKLRKDGIVKVDLVLNPAIVPNSCLQDALLV